ncbi:MAG: hypothetical protein ABI540_03780 [Spartobacteria bacterium]
MSERLPLRSDRVLRVVTKSPVRRQKDYFGRSLGIAAVLLALAIVYVAWASTRDTTHERGEGKESSTVRNFATQAGVQSQPRGSRVASGWD